jgi:hypothetical protein
MASDQENPRNNTMSGQRCEGAKMTNMKTPEKQAAYGGLLRLAAREVIAIRGADRVLSGVGSRYPDAGT